MAQHQAVVIGGSLGSTAALRQLLAGLPADLQAAVFVATHIPQTSAGSLPAMMQDTCRLPTSLAQDGQPIEHGHVYFAAPNRHLMVTGHIISLGQGPRENMMRPAIDALFRSAALAFGPRVIGVVLSGLLNDGAAGLHAIKACGGVTVVQDPLDAEAPDMPRAALEAAEIDHVAPASALGSLISDLVQTEAGPPGTPPEALALEVQIALGRHAGSEQLRKAAEPVPLTCPHCQGVLSEMRQGGPLRFRCQVGHALTAEALDSAQHGDVEEAIRIAMRLIEERRELVGKMARQARKHGRRAVAELYEARELEYDAYAATLRRAAMLSLQSGGDPGPDPFDDPQ